MIDHICANKNIILSRTVKNLLWHFVTQCTHWFQNSVLFALWLSFFEASTFSLAYLHTSTTFLICPHRRGGRNIFFADPVGVGVSFRRVPLPLTFVWMHNILWTNGCILTNFIWTYHLDSLKIFLSRARHVFNSKVLVYMVTFLHLQINFAMCLQQKLSQLRKL